MTFDELQLNGRVAVVTGGSRGIGRGIAELLAERGAAVAIAYREQDKAAAEFVADARGRGGRAWAGRCDVAAEPEVTAFFESVASELGPVDILVNNAAINRDVHVMFMDTARWTEHDAGEPPGSVSLHQSGHEGYAAARVGPDHQHQLAEREDAAAGPDGIRSVEGRAGGVHARALA